MRIVIAGGNAAGMSAAAKLKRVHKDAEVILVESKDYISFGACGLPYYIGDFFDDEKRMIVRTKDQAEKMGLQVLLKHQVTFVDEIKKTVTVLNLVDQTVDVVSYDKLLIATGARAIVPPIKNIAEAMNAKKNVFTLRDLEDGNAIREKMLDKEIQNITVVGAGFIGLELVDAAMHQGKKVRVFQLEDRILKDVFDQEITDLLEQELRDSGVELHMNTAVKELVIDEVMKVKAGDKEYETDLVLITAGIRPNTEFLAETSVTCAANGAVLINEYGETSVTDIYAAGDCAVVKHHLKEQPSYLPLATSANKLGRIVGENLAGGRKAFPGALGASCLKLLSLEAGRVGLSEDEARKNGYNPKTVFISDKNHTDYYPGQEALYIKLVYDKETKVILGGQLAGKSDAVMRTNVLSAAVTAGMTTEQLGMMDFCYAPPFARTWDILNIAGNAAK